MKIASAALQMGYSHTKLQYHEVHESLRAWVGQRQPAPADSPQRLLSPLPPVQISDVGKAEASAIEKNTDAAENDPILSLIRALVSMLTGQEVKIFDPSGLQSNSTTPELQAPDQTPVPTPRQQSAGYGIEYDRHESYNETEQARFDAAGVIRTSDGKEIAFSVSLSMTRSYHAESDVSIRAGDARQKKDPLLLNFNGNAAQLTEQRFSFDLDADGKNESINFVTGGSGFLALDRNGDGKINDGAELFGTRSGNGFAELAALDSDHNGWIDESDAAYEHLRVWSKDSAGNDRLTTLREAGVGALSLDRVDTPFDIKNSSNVLQGQIRSSGIFLRENGKAGTMQQIDLTV